MIVLTPCSRCRRHVRAVATTCPFCGSAVESARAMHVVRERLPRAAIAVLGASAIVLGCSSSDTSSTDAGYAPPYGHPPVDSAVDSLPADGSADGASDARDADGGPTDTGSPGNLYGAPAYGAPPTDGG